MLIQGLSNLDVFMAKCRLSGLENYELPLRNSMCLSKDGISLILPKITDREGLHTTYIRSILDRVSSSINEVVVYKTWTRAFYSMIVFIKDCDIKLVLAVSHSNSIRETDESYKINSDLAEIEVSKNTWKFKIKFKNKEE